MSATVVIGGAVVALWYYTTYVNPTLTRRLRDETMIAPREFQSMRQLEEDRAIRRVRARQASRQNAGFMVKGQVAPFLSRERNGIRERRTTRTRSMVEMLS